ncbi:tetratricopeptide repeat protein, partial [Myxococcota bacterium]|nr:tetratricopeptide repeat protein [Myxococcota bacterium]
AFDALRRSQIGRKDSAALVTLWSQAGEHDAFGLATDLEDAGDLAGAAEVLRAAPESLVSLVRLSRVLEAQESWSEAFAVSRRLASVSHDPARRQAIEAHQRWMLAEKLATTDEAWELYRQLHEDRPSDVSVLEALARIAGARGETGLALQYLERLSASSLPAADAARYARRAAEIHETAGNHAEARQSWLTALSHVPEDREALLGLRRIAEAQSDWQSLVGVLAREASISAGDERVERFAEIARLWEQKLNEPRVAAESWRLVLEQAPEHTEALERLLTLSEQNGDWSGFVEVGTTLLRRAQGAERAALLRRLGLAQLNQLHNEPAALRLLDEAVFGETTDVEAAVALERLRGARGETEEVVRVVRRLAGVSSDAEAVALLTRAARMTLELIQDRGRAAELYVELLGRNPENVEALRFTSDHAFRAGDNARAVEMFERMEPTTGGWDIDDFDDKVEISLYFFHYASALLSLGRENEALTRLQRALELNPRHLPSLRASGPIYMRRRQWEAAEAIWRNVLELTSGTANADDLANTYVNLGDCDRVMGRADRARKRYAKALELRGNDVRALKGLASSLGAEGDWNGAFTQLRNLISTAPDVADVVDAHIQAAWVLDARLNLADKARQYLDAALAVSPGEPEVLVRLGELALRRRDWTSGISLAEQALASAKIGAMAGRAGVVLAVALRASGDNGAAARAYEEALSQDSALSDRLSGQGIEGWPQVAEVLKAQAQEPR